MKNRIALLLAISASLFLLGACATTGTHTSQPVKESFNQLNAALKERTFTALVGLHVHGYHYVDGEGKPLDGKSQSKRKGSKGLLTKKFALAKGETGKGMVMAIKGNSKIHLALSKAGGFGGAWNPSNVIIEYGRPITPEDLTPQAFARSLSSLIIIKGLEPESEFDDLLKDQNP
jgi:hypothetical protein